MATEKAAKKTLNVGDFYPADLSKVKVAPHEELKGERDDYVAKYEAIRFDHNKDVKLDKDVYNELHGMYEDIKERGIQDPAQGYVKKDDTDGQTYLYIITGRQRRGLLELMRRREGVRKDDKFVVNIIKESDVLTMLQAQWASNKHRVEESFFSQAAYIRGFRKANWSNKQIADKMHVSEALIAQIVRIDESPYLANLVKSKRLGLDMVADRFASKDFVDAFRDPTSKKINEEALEAKVESILEEMVQKGFAISRNGARLFMKQGQSNEPSGSPKTHINKDAWTRIKDAPPTVVPLPFQLLAKAALGEDHHTIADLIKIHKDLEWLSRVEWRSAAEIKRDQKAAAAANAAANAKINAEMGIVPPNTKTTAADVPSAQTETAEDEQWDMPEGDEL